MCSMALLLERLGATLIAPKFFVGSLKEVSDSQIAAKVSQEVLFLRREPVLLPVTAKPWSSGWARGGKEERETENK